MASKKKSKKKSTQPRSMLAKPKGKRPPRQVFLTYNPATGDPGYPGATKRAAMNLRSFLHSEVAGPYVLAERRGNE